MDDQPRVIDLVPTRLAVFLVPLVAGVAIIAGLEGLHAWMPHLSRFTTNGRVAAFDLDGRGSLAVWFSSMALAAASLVAVLVYSIRRHKVDDYRGRYRIWLWAALCCMVMSLDKTAGLHEGFKEMMALVSGTRVFGDGSIWWIVPYFFLLGAIGTRLLVDMRRCVLSSTVLVGTAVCYGVGVASRFGWLVPVGSEHAVMLKGGAEMFGDLLLVLAMGLHARYVTLDAQGLILPPRRRTRRVVDEADEEMGLEIKVHPPHGIPRPATVPVQQPRTFVNATPVAAAPAPAPAASAPVQRKLTKEERKALKRRLDKMRKEREQRR